MTITIKHSIILLMLCSCYFILSAQQGKLDSLKALIKKDKEDTNRVNHLNKIGEEYKKVGNYDSSLHYSNAAMQLAQTLNFNKGIANSYEIFGIVYFYRGNYSDALKNHFAALKIRETIGDKNGIATSYNDIGSVYYSQGNYPETLKNYFASLKLYEAIGDIQGIANSYNNIGLVYYSQGNYPDALKNHFAALKIQEAIGDKYGTACSYNNIGIVYDSQGNCIDALKNYFASLKIRLAIGDKKGIAMSYNNIGFVYEAQGNNTEALKNHFASLKIKEAIDDKDGIASSYNNIGNIYKNLGNYTDALKNHFASLKIYEAIGDRQGIAESYGNIGETYRKTGDLNNAEIYLTKATVIFKEIGNKEGLKDCEQNLSELDSATGNFRQAYEHYKLYTIYKDSLDNEEVRKKTIQQSMAYEFEKKETADKANQDKKEAVIQAEARKQEIIIWLVAIGSLLVALFILNSYKQRQSKRKIITTVVETEEKERKRFAEDLHDGLGPLLSSVSLYVNELQSEIHGHDKKTEFFKIANDLIDESIRNTRMIANNLMPGVLNDYGLIIALETFCNKLKKTGAIEVTIHTELKDKRYNTVVEITLYRVILEMINNTLKHAKANSIDIEIHEKDKYLNVSYNDNGKGFEVEKTMNDPQKGLGLNNIVTRIKTIGGKCYFQSAIDKGTQVNIEVNYKKFIV